MKQSIVKRGFLSALVGAALVVVLAGASFGQSRILDTSVPLRVDEASSVVVWPRDAASVWRSNDVIRGEFGSAALSAGAVTVTNASILSTDLVLATWASTGKVGAVIATVGSGTVALRSTSTNDQTGTINWLAIRQ